MKLFDNLSKTSKLMLAAIAAVCLALLLLGLLVTTWIFPFEKPSAFAAGIIVGCLHSMLKVILLEKSINQTLDMEKERAASFSHLHTMGRYVLTIAVFAAVILYPNVFGLFGAIIGVVSLQLAAHITNRMLKKD